MRPAPTGRSLPPSLQASRAMHCKGTLAVTGTPHPARPACPLVSADLARQCTCATAGCASESDPGERAGQRPVRVQSQGPTRARARPEPGPCQAHARAWPRPAQRGETARPGGAAGRAEPARGSHWRKLRRIELLEKL